MRDHVVDVLRVGVQCGERVHLALNRQHQLQPVNQSVSQSGNQSVSQVVIRSGS